MEGVAVSNALVANSKLLGAFPYNYSSMVFHDGLNVSVDLLGLFSDANVAPKAPNAEIGTVDNEARNFFIPAVYAAQQITDQLSWGVHVGAPFGLETVWPSNTFSDFYSVDQSLNAGGLIAGLHPTKTSLDLFAVSPSVVSSLQATLVWQLG